MTSTEDKLAGGYAKPEELLIVGVDEIPPGVGDAETFADPYRIDGPNDDLIKSVEMNGVRIPVIVVSRRYGRSDRCKIVVAGRQRVMAQRLVNARRKAKGDNYPGLVPYVVKEGDESTVILDNEHRRNDPIWVKAYNLKKLIQRNIPYPEALAHFSEDGKPLTKATGDAWLRLLKLAPEYLAEVKAGTLPYATAYELGKHPQDKQRGILEAIRAAEGAIKGANGVANVKAVAEALPAAPPKAQNGAPVKGNAQTGPAINGDRLVSSLENAGPAVVPPHDPALTPRREHVDHPKPPPIVKDRAARLTARHIEIIATQLAPTEFEPLENEEQKLAFAIFGVCAGACEIDALKEWPWIHKIVKKAVGSK